VEDAQIPESKTMTADEHLDKIVEQCRSVAATPEMLLVHALFSTTIVAIEGLRLIASQGSHPESSSAKCDLHKILGLWPEELL
jgi:hypothetical protein